MKIRRFNDIYLDALLVVAIIAAIFVTRMALAQLVHVCTPGQVERWDCNAATTTRVMTATEMSTQTSVWPSMLNPVVRPTP
jgi:hypothetical protein